MIDIKLLREKPEAIKKALTKKRVDPVTLDNVLALDGEKRHFLKKIEELQSKRNRTSKAMPGLAGKEKEAALKEMQFVKERLAELSPKLEHIEKELLGLIAALPNPPLESVPEGAGDESNEVLRVVGKKREFSFEVRDHVEIAKKGDMLELEAAATGSGSRFYYLKNDAVRLEFALLQFMLEKLSGKGFTPVIPPVLVKEKAMYGTGFFPADRNEIYHVNPEDDDLYLVGTAEVPLCMMYAERTLETEKLPIRLAGFSTCFRREAGTYGKDTRGIFRVHQFDKVEMFSFCDPSKSEKEHEFLLSTQEEIMQNLQLHYRVVNICGGDLGAPAAKKYDIEAWIPSQQKFRELTSCSNCTDFQARRAGIRSKNKETEFVHTLNGTAVAMSRMIIAIMENYQKKDGTFEMPEVLRKYL